MDEILEGFYRFAKRHWVALATVAAVVIALVIWGASSLFTKAKTALGSLLGVDWWESKLGGKTSGPITDVTGLVGSAASTAAYAAVVNDHSQGFYNSALQEYSYDANFDTTLAGQGTSGWPWTSYDNWVSNGYPALPTASSVTVDANGVYHNEYQ